MIKWIALLFVTLGVLLIAVDNHKVWLWDYLPVHTQVDLLWRQDVALLAKAGALPYALTQISKSQVIPLTPLAKSLFSRIEAPHPINSQGQNALTIKALTFHEGSQLGVSLHYEITSLETGNTLWESGRTFLVNGNSKDKNSAEDPIFPQE